MATKPAAFPRAPLFGAAALVVFALGCAVAGRMSGATTVPQGAAAVAERTLRFADRADGAVLVYAPPESAPIEVITGQSGFLRGTLRGLARERRRDGIGAGAPFHLTAWSDGRLTLADPSTGRDIELESFGPTNEAVFARLLTVEAATP